MTTVRLQTLYKPLLTPQTTFPLQQNSKTHRTRFSVCSYAFPTGVEEVVTALASSHPGWAAGLTANTCVFVTGIKALLNGLTWMGVLHSWFLGSSVFAAFGAGAIMQSLRIDVNQVTKVKLEQKKAEGVAEERSGRRSIGSVWGSGFAGVVCAILALTTQNYEFYRIGFVASFGSKLSDTVSSEIGKAYGKRTFLVTTFEACPRGTEGAISLEGTLAGVVAAVGYSFIALSLDQVSMKGTGIVIVSSVVANFLESFIGASFQNKTRLSNDVVNVIQISIAATIAIAFNSTF